MRRPPNFFRRPQCVIQRKLTFYLDARGKDNQPLRDVLWRDGSHNVRKMVLTIQFSAQMGGTVGVLMRKEEKLLDLEGEAGQTVKFKKRGLPNAVVTSKPHYSDFFLAALSLVVHQTDLTMEPSVLAPFVFVLTNEELQFLEHQNHGLSNQAVNHRDGG